MIFDISDSEFRNIMNDDVLALPKRWNGCDFYCELKNLFDYYKDKINPYKNYARRYDAIYCNTIYVDTKKINSVCNYILCAVENYFNGFPSTAYKRFNRAMSLLMETSLKIYQKSAFEQFDDKLNLFRAVKVDENIPYDRKRVFHTPYTLRAKVSTSRYSIAGYPSLYLGTSLDLCCEEINYNIHENFALAARFQLERNIESSGINIRVIELGIKPQDFTENRESRDKKRSRQIPNKLLNDSAVQSAYLLWYPLIAACSFIRKNKNDPFAAEYIIPQLLMQWVRNEMGRARVGDYYYYDQLIGIRYFSCASIRSSDMGFNYVFPTSGRKNQDDERYCAVLSRSFKLTAPALIHEYDSVFDCEQDLKNNNNLDFI